MGFWARFVGKVLKLNAWKAFAVVFSPLVIFFIPASWLVLMFGEVTDSFGFKGLLYVQLQYGSLTIWNLGAASMIANRHKLETFSHKSNEFFSWLALIAEVIGLTAIALMALQTVLKVFPESQISIFSMIRTYSMVILWLLVLFSIFLFSKTLNDYSEMKTGYRRVTNFVIPFYLLMLPFLYGIIHKRVKSTMIDE